MALFIRNIFYDCLKYLEKDVFLIITGARQVGKTTLLKQIYKHLKEKGQPVYFINLEDPDYLKLLNKHPRNIFNLYQYPEEKKSFILIDEIQYLNNPTNFLKYLYDEYADRMQLIVSGSSAFYLDVKFKDSLAGRKKIFTLPTLTLDEFLIFKERSELSDMVKKIPVQQLTLQHLPLSAQREIEKYMNEYMIYGGYPRVVLSTDPNEKTEILQELLTSYIKKDILESGIKNNQNVLALLKILADQTGSLLNVNSLSRVLRLSHSAIENYIFILKKAFILITIPPFNRNIRSEIRKMPKVFFADTGLRNALLKNFEPLDLRRDRGDLYENFIFRQLFDRVSIDEIKFWRTQQGNEVDFVISDRFAYEVKYQAEMIRLSKYTKFLKTYPDISLKFIYRVGQPLEKHRDIFLRF